MSIPNEAVEAASRAVPAGASIDQDDLRNILEAAAPVLMAQAWDEGRSAGFRDAYVDEEEEEDNPYRRQP